MGHVQVRTRIPESAFQDWLYRSDNALILTDRHGMVRGVSELFLRVTGYQDPEVRGRLLDAFVHGDVEQPVFRALAERAAATFVHPVPVVDLRCADGTTKRTRVYVSEVLSDLFADGYLFAFPDASPTQISLPETFFRRLVFDINLGIVLINRDGRIVEVSQMACEIFGLAKHQLINAKVDDVLADLPEEHRILRRTLLEGVKVRNYAITWNNGIQRYELLIDSDTVRDEQGNAIGAYLVFKDVTNLRSLEEQIQRHDRLAMIGQIAAGTAHEIRNPLTSIKGFVQMLRHSLEEKGLQKEKQFTEIMLNELNRINALVSELLLLSKPRDVQYQLVDLNHVLAEIMPIVRSEALLHGIEVVEHLDGNLPMVIGDSELLKQVFLNICKNGIEAMGNEGTLTISYRIDEKEKTVSIDIHDTGPGIPPYVLDKIFDPFFTTKENGTGLGLPVCQRIIHDIGGAIRVSTKGYGTTFHIIISISSS
ncbi:hypothetical protein JCM14719A_03550 [Calditerricola satsumensis]|uniref:histidine kinase n=1 Tax=Calditerricola satsumensis TaxID=373054 RepID=A0A8J3FD43_9BACI|nr:hypothetical protein GCM10007043_22790 [Calditerricola satsumensis]